MPSCLVPSILEISRLHQVFSEWSHCMRTRILHSRCPRCAKFSFKRGSNFPLSLPGYPRSAWELDCRFVLQFMEACWGVASWNTCNCCNCMQLGPASHSGCIENCKQELQWFGSCSSLSDTSHKRLHDAPWFHCGRWRWSEVAGVSPRFNPCWSTT